jgi:hypothetical protein
MKQLLLIILLFCPVLVLAESKAVVLPVESEQTLTPHEQEVCDKYNICDSDPGCVDDEEEAPLESDQTLDPQPISK